MSLPPPTPGPRQLSIESVTLQKLVEQLQRKALPQITDGGVDSVTLERPAVRIVVRGHGDDFCGWPGCASLFRIENRFDKERAMDVHDRNHLDMSPRTVSVFVPYPVKNHDRMRISAAIQVATEQGRLTKLNIPSHTSLSVSFWSHDAPCRHCNDLSVLDAPPQLTPLCEHPRIARVITTPPPPNTTTVVNVSSPPPPTIVEDVRSPPRRDIIHTHSPRTIHIPDYDFALKPEPKKPFDFEIANQVWEQLKHAYLRGDEARANVKRNTLRNIL